STGPPLSPPSDACSSTSTPSTSPSARCSSTARTRNGYGPPAWATSSVRPCCVADAEPASAVDRVAVAFARVLRSSGLTVPLGTVVTFAEALAAVGIGERAGVYWAGRTTLVRKPEDIGVYDKAFDAFWLGRSSGTLAVPVAGETVTLVLDDPDAEEGPSGAVEEEIEGPVLAVRYSGHEILRHKDFAAYSADE